ncbi:MAG: ABC transporter permease [Thermoflexales bacterium]|jgi:ABC-2 type transport system permease protein|nr:ABC transporter permease [Thermoflexales bacterium]
MNKLSESLRIIWAIAAKDIVDATKNKVTLSIMLGVGFMMLSGLALPWLLGLKDTPSAVIYDPDRTTLLRALRTRREFNLRFVDSLEELETDLAESPRPALGLAIPPGFGQSPGSAGTVEVDGYAAHWADPAKIAELTAYFEDQLGKASWQTVHIDVGDRLAYPELYSGGQPFMTAISLTTIVLVIGLAIVPYLLVEEKETHTFDALLVSPARFSQVVAGKAVTGLFYCLVAAAVFLLFNAYLVVHWGVAALAVLLGAALGVAIGLLAGASSDNPATINMWMGLFIMLLIVPTLLEQLSSSKMPEFVRVILPWLPSVTMGRLLRIAMAGDIQAAPILSNAAVLAVTALAVYALVVWRVRQVDR